MFIEQSHDEVYGCLKGGSRKSEGKRLAISMVEYAWLSEKEESKWRICFPNNTAYSVNSIRRTGIQQIYTAYSDKLDTAYFSSDTETVDKETHMAEPNNYITATRKNFVSNDNEGRMVEKCIVKIQGTFLEKIRNDAFNGDKEENPYEHINKFLDVVGPIKIIGLTQDRFRLSIFPVSLTKAAYEWFTKECMGSITTWDNMVEKFILKFHHLSDHNEEETEEDDNPNETNNIPEILRIKGNLFDFETPLCEAYHEFSCLLKIDTDLFTYDIQNFKTYGEYKQEMNDDKSKDIEKPWSKNESIDEGPFQMGTFRETLTEGTEGAPHLGPERPRVYFDLSPEDKERYNTDIRATNILLQGLPKDIYSLINHYTDAKDIWDNVKMLLEGSELTKEDRESQLYDDFEHFRQNKGETIHNYYVWFAKLINDMRNIKMTMSRMQLNSKFVNNMLPEWGRFVIAVKLNRGLRDSNYDQLYI
ncbi:hypothetical protein Tco_1220027 [Tanacetum coccineum]